MPVKPTITELSIRRLTTAQSFERGWDYCHSGAVRSLHRRGDTLRAEVQGGQYQPYQVVVELDEAGIVSARCTCPYDWGGCCKHVVATLLAYSENPEEVEARPTIEELLAGLDRDALKALLAELMAQHPELISALELRLAVRPVQGKAITGTSPDAQRRQHTTSIDITAIRRQVQYHTRPSLRGDYAAAGDVVAALHQIVRTAEQFVAAGDGRNGLAILEALIEEILPVLTQFGDPDGGFGSLFDQVGQVMAEALLTADLSPEERGKWAERLDGWQADLSDYVLDEAFDIANAAAVQGWDFEPLERVLRGEIDARGAWDIEPPWFATELAEARLNVLARQGRIQEYLNVALAERRRERYVAMLVQVGRWQEAVAYALRHMAAPQEALALAKTLREHGQVPAALKVGKRGLVLPGHKDDLAGWLRDAASASGDAALALHASLVAFRELPSLTEYQAVRAAAGEGWPGVRARLLHALNEGDRANASGSLEARVDIYLHEGMVDEAIRAVDAERYAGHNVLAKVAGAAWQSHPDWVIGRCCGQAEPVLDLGRSNAYSDAIYWLEAARQAYLAAGRAEEWRAYCRRLLEKHARKHSLVPQLKAML